MKRHALNIAAFVWAIAEATLFFIVPDVLLCYIGLKRGARAAATASLIAAIGAACGGVLMYLWSQIDPTAAHAAVLAVPAIGDAMAARAAAAMSENWFVATLLGPLSSTPFKLYAILAPHAGAGPAAFAVASVLARLPRFLIVSVGTALIGRWLEPKLGAQRLTLILAGAWIAFYAAFFALVPG